MTHLHFPMVGVGASAGGLDAFSKLVASVPADFGGSIVYVTHLSPDRESNLVQILSVFSKLPVSEIAAGVMPERGRIYITPPQADVTLENGVFSLHPRPDRLLMHLPIDQFFVSIAEEMGSQAIGVILSGTGADGTAGLLAIKDRGGVTFVQSGGTAKFKEMPLNAGKAIGVADFVLPPEEIAGQLDHICRNPGFLDTKQEGSFVFDEATLNELFSLLRREVGVDFSGYKSGTVGRRITRRMVFVRAKSLEDYVKFLKLNPEEIKILFREILINVTSFFRDPELFVALETVVFPALLKRHTEQGGLRIWVPGCATGEEAYSIAIGLLEFLNANGLDANFQIFGSDISAPSIAKARTGLFKEESLQQISPGHLHKYFTKSNGSYQINKLVRNHLVFAVHNVIKDPPFSNLDLVSCRNLLIYFGASLQARVLNMFHYALRPGGHLVLGPAESIGGKSVLFTCSDNKHKIFSRSSTSVRPFPDAMMEPFFKKGTTKIIDESRGDKLDGEENIIKQTDKFLLSRFAPVGVLVDENLRIVQFRGDTSPFVSPAPGSSSLTVMEMIRSELRLDVRSCVNEAIATGKSVSKPISCEVNGRQRHYMMEAVEVARSGISGKFVLVIFNDRRESPGAYSRRPTWRHFVGRWMAFLGGQAQLPAESAQIENSALREQLSRSLEDSDAKNEESRAINEELLSANEELQSSNEELETAKEEFQSSNEELQTVNDELKIRAVELAESRDNVANLLASSQIPVVMVDSSQKIRVFTMAAEKLFNFIPTDVGRYIGDINTGLEAIDLGDLGKTVIDSLQTIERQVVGRQGAKFKMAVCPFMTSDKKIDGAVFSFVSVDAVITEVEKKSLVLADRIVDTVREPLLVLDQSLRVQMANKSFYTKFKTTAQETLNAEVYEIGRGQWNIPELRRLLSDVIGNKKTFEGYEAALNFPRIGRRVMLLNAREIQDGGKYSGLILLAFEDITERTKQENNFRLIFSASQMGMLQTRASGEIVFVNKEVERIFDYAPGELVGKHINTLLPERLRAPHTKHMMEYWAHPTVRPMDARRDLVGLTKTGREFHVEVSLVPMEADGEAFAVLGVFDVSFRDEAAAVQRAKDAAELASNAKGKFLANMSHEIRTPLSAIVGFSEVLENDPSQASRFVGIIRRNAKHLASLIDDILDLSKIEAGQINLESAALNLREEVDGVISMLAEKAKTKGLALSCTYEDGLPKVVRSDATRLRQILINVIGNSIKFTEKGSVDIKVRAEATKADAAFRRVIFTVIDSGCGIAESAHAKVFESFSQEAASTARQYGGTGLGLALSRELARLMNGDVVLRRSEPGVGSTFEVAITFESLDSTNKAPLAPSLGPQSASEKEKFSLQGLRVLLVDDAEDNRVLFDRILNVRGADVGLAKDGLEGVKMALEQKYDVILMDVQMPDLNGREATAKLRASGYAGPIVALSAFATKEEKEKCIAAGMNEYLTKPISGDDLAKVVAKWGRGLR